MSLKTYLIILKTGVYLSFVSIFLVFGNLLFPFITSKQIYFNILIELLMIFWLAMIIKYPAFRPKKALITFGLLGFFGALLISTIFSVDFNLSFWGDIERMLGWFHILHFFLFYLIVITAFRDWRDWRNLFIASLAAAAAVSLYSIYKIPYSTIGNTTYVSGYLIFNIYFALILFFRRFAEGRKKAEDWLINSLYLAVIFIMLLALEGTHTRGAYVGLGVSVLLLLFLAVIYSQSKKVKIYSLAAALTAIALAALVFSFPESNLVKNNKLLSVITQISSKHKTFQTRLISWKAAARDFKNHPILGAGYGNFAISFDKYFDPEFYSHTPTETYFDRAHNNLVDLASTAGLLGLLSYFFMLAAVFYYLSKGKKQGQINTNEYVLIVCLLVAYFIQNLAVFDSLVTYISLMLILGYIYWLKNGQEETRENQAAAGSDSGEIKALAFAGILFFIIIYQFNIKPIMMLDGTINGQVKFAKGDIAAGVEEYKKALSFETGLDRDSRASLINAVNGMQNNLASLDKDMAREIIDYIIIQAEENVKLNPLDSMMQMQLAQTLNTASLLYTDNQTKFYFYSDRALKAMDESIKASPRRSTIYFGKAQIYMARNNKEKAIETLKYAASLNEKFAEAVCLLAKVSIYYKEEKSGYEAMDKCLDSGGVSYLNPADLIKILINHYAENKDNLRDLILYERLSALEPGNAKVWVSLALLYSQLEKKDQALAATRKAMELDSSLRPAGEEFIRKLEGK